MRSQPVQARSRETVERILATAARLLDEVGVDEFNTNLLAERAGVRVRSVYRYFPDKLAVILAVAEQLAAKESGHVTAFAAVADANIEWREAIDRSLDAYLEGAKAQPGFLGIRRAMQAVPELREVERQANRVLTDLLADALAARGLPLPPRRRRAIAAVIVQTVAANLDLSLMEEPRAARLIVEELRRLLKAYLWSHVQ